MILSGNRPTPEQERYLIYQLPMARGQQYIHAYAVSQGADTVWANEKDDIFKRVQDILLATRRNHESQLQTQRQGLPADSPQILQGVEHEAR